MQIKSHFDSLQNEYASKQRNLIKSLLASKDSNNIKVLRLYFENIERIKPSSGEKLEKAKILLNHPDATLNDTSISVWQLCEEKD